MTTDHQPAESHFMEHPEVVAYMEKIFPAIVEESDRGAVLLGAAQIDAHLRSLFEELLPNVTTSKRRKEIFSFTGPFGSLSSKLDIAYTCRILPHSLVQAIHKFRKLRNDRAHEAAAFLLDDHAAEVREVFSLLGPGVGTGVGRITVDLLLENALAQLDALESPSSGGELMFKDRADVLRYVNANKHHLVKLESHRLKWEVAVAVGLICGLIVLHREKLLSVIADNDTLAFPRKPDA